jgi:hypothetical protein
MKSSQETKITICSILKIFASVKRIIAIAVTFVFCHLTLSGKIDSAQFIPIFSMIVGYYFGRTTESENNKDLNGSGVKDNHIP